MFAELGLILSYRINNRLRGTDLVEDLTLNGRKVYWWHRLFNNLTGRIGCSIIAGALVGFYVNEVFNPVEWISYTIGILTSLGVLWWATLGWGKYFSAATGGYAPNEREIGWIDWIGDLIKGNTYKINRLRGAVCMGLRGWFYAQPLFLAFAGLNYYLSGNLSLSIEIAAVGLGMLLQGFWYWFSAYFPSYQTIDIAERNTGSWFAFLLIVIFNLMLL